MTYNPLEKSTSRTSKAVEEKKEHPPTKELFDDFDKISDYWYFRKDNNAEIRIENSVLKLVLKPTEALYYSNAEISDGDFNDLKWEHGNLEFKARLLGDHYGSAGWGFWNYTMVVDDCIPIWFIYLRSRSNKYPLNGFFVQVKNIITPIKYFYDLPTSIKIALKLFKPFIPLKFTTLKPVMQDLDLTKWHKYTILWKENTLEFLIDNNLVTRINVPRSKYRYRTDAWIDNAVFQAYKNDYAKVYRHITHENRIGNTLEIDYVKLWL